MIAPLPGDIFRPGQVLNNTYEIDGILGRGGTGEVYRARNQISGRVVALKALNAEFSGNADYLELMKREEEMRDIVHDAVVRYSDNSRTADGHVFLVMDFVDGPSLNEWLQRGNASPRDLLIVAHRVAEGLVVTHARNIVHRDLSPDNIILRKGDPAQAVIIDFGIAKDNSAGARTIVGNDFAGKYEYAAPEQMDGRAEARSDLYALGASLLATYRGQVPNVGTTPGEVVRRKGKPLTTEGVPEPLKGVIDWLTQPDPAQRPASAAELVVRLDEVLTSKSRKTVLTKPAAKPARRSYLGILLAPLLLAGVAAAVFYSEVWRQLMPEPLPVASPYVLEATNPAEGVPVLSGNAPDDQQKSAILSAFAAATGNTAAPESLTLATGSPSATWGQDVASVLDASQGLKDWHLQVSDRSIGAFGTADTEDDKARITAAMQAAAQKAGYSLSLTIDVPIPDLPVADVQGLLTRLETCGPLEVIAPGSGKFAPDAPIDVSGTVADEGDKAKIQTALEAVAGARPVTVNLSVLTGPICLIQSVLPKVGSGNTAISLGYSDTNEVNLAGIYAQGQAPTADILIPDSETGGYVWVLFVDTDGIVFNLLPNQLSPGFRVSDIGVTEGGMRRIRVAYSDAEYTADNQLIHFQPKGDDHGKSMFFAIFTEQPLYDGLRPIEESTEAAAEALTQAFASPGNQPTAIASRLMDLRN